MPWQFVNGMDGTLSPTSLFPSGIAHMEVKDDSFGCRSEDGSPLMGEPFGVFQKIFQTLNCLG